MIEKYQKTPAASDALAILAQAYLRLGLDGLAADTVRVLKLNYPEHSEIGALEASLVR